MQIDEKVRDALESSVTREKLNYRIHFKDLEDEEDMIGPGWLLGWGWGWRQCKGQWKLWG